MRKRYQGPADKQPTDCGRSHPQPFCLCVACEDAVTDSDLELHAWPPSRGGHGVLALHTPSGLALLVRSERTRKANREQARQRLRVVHKVLADFERSNLERAIGHAIDDGEPS